MNTAEMKVTYGDIEVAYDEAANLWRFELRGRERSAVSLAKAKEAIDAPPPKDKKPFQRFKAYFSRYSEKFIVVEVTSIAESTGYRRQKDCWIIENGRRTKVGADDLYAITPDNDARIGEHERRAKEIQALEEKNKEVFRAVTKIDLEGCE